MAKGLDMGERRLLKEMMCMFLSSLTFSGSNSVRYFDHVWLSKTTDVVGGKRGNMK